MTKLPSRRATVCSTLAIATALLVGASPAAAQALLGTVTSSSGVGTITNDGALTNIPVTGQQAIINWSATGPSSNGVTTFSNAGSTTNFTGQSDFAILNRVAPTVTGNSIFMGGNINSSVNGQVGGTVYFYSPNGIVIGSNAAINVGSLGLTTLPIADNQGVWMTGFGTSAPQVAFGAATNVASFVRTETSAGGALNANGIGNYVALVAPRVEHRGIIRTDSGAALVAAGAATITFNPTGLYNIAVTTGSSDANGVVVDGGRIERNSSATSNHRAYLVSVPANNAMTMLVQGGAQLGFDIAGAAAFEGNAVILSAGRDVVNGSAIGAQTAPASATIDRATIGSELVTNATSIARVSTNTGATSLGRDALLAAPVINVLAENDRLDIGGSLVARADRSGANATGGLITVAARNGQTLSVGGSVVASADGSGTQAADDGLNGGNGTGGIVDVVASNGGTLSIAGGLDVRARGFGGFHGFTNGAAGSGTGGIINVGASGGSSSLAVGAFTSLDVGGTGGTTIECLACSVSGGSGTGGTINVTGGGRAPNSGANRLDFNGGLALFAQGSGGAGDLAAGNGRGGILRLVTSDGTIVTSQLAFLMAADGFGGAYLGSGSGAGGAGIGGEAQIGAYDSGGGSFTLAGGEGQIFLTATGIGGSANQGIGTGGTGQGGRLAIDAMGAAITLNGDVFMIADGDGGSAFLGTGGRGTGGNIFAHAYGSNLTINGALSQLATSFGGDGIVGGAAQGGTVVVAAETGSALAVSGEVDLDASALGGFGGSASGGIGGAARGGDASLFAGTGGSLAVGSVFLTSFGFGGGGFAGGLAQGGHGTITSNVGNVDIGGPVLAFLSANGGVGDGANGGAATGGQFELVADGGTLDIGGPVSLSTDALGGGTFGELASGGAATGGGLQVHASNGGTLTLASSLSAISGGHGGEATATGGRAGDGRGGSIDVAATGANSTLDARDSLFLSADGGGGIAICGECSTGGTGGNGTGGTVSVHTFGGNGNRVLVGNSLSLSANGLGSDSSGGAGGIGQGGGSGVFLNNDGRIAVGGGLALSARGDGGYHFNGGQAGAGIGGDAQIVLAGLATSLLTVGTDLGVEVDRSTTLDSSGYGGSAGVVAGGIGGAGTGGWSRIYGTGGSATFGGNVVIEAEGEGGNGENGAGGAGVGGRARLNADGAAYRIAGTVGIVTDATGGFGRDGGAASLRAVETDTNNSGMFANNGGSIVVDGEATLSANAVGGAGANGGHGGAASAGQASVVVGGSATGNGSITLGDVFMTAIATGGVGAAGGASQVGGNGGNAIGGLAELATTNSATGTNRLTVGRASLHALAVGGDGGRGGDGPTGQSGGSGGSGTGGTAVVLASAGNGALNAVDLDLFATGNGGHGGAGGNGSEGTGGTGGAGGVGDGGVVIAGMVSGTPTATTSGTFNAATLLGWADSYGGRGGNGGIGTVGPGNGGNGGDALHSFNQLLARGGTVTIGDAQLLVDTRGGDGGTGALAGNGGTAYTPDVLVTVTNRFEQPTARATLTVTDLNFYSNAGSSTGAVAGRAIALGGPQLLVQNSDARFGSYSLSSTAGDGIDPTSLADPIRIINGSVIVDSDFHQSTANRMSVLLDNGSLSAASLTLDAVTFERDASFATPATLGTISAGNIAVLSGQDIVLDANLSSRDTLTLAAPRSVAVGNLTTTGTTGSDIIVTAGSNVATGAINASRAVDVQAGGDFTTGGLTAATTAQATVGGTVIINGAWTSPLSRIVSNDLQIGASGGIAGERADLISRNATQLLIGDGLSGSGYAIDNAEFGRLTAGIVNVIGRSDASAAIDTLVGNLSLAGLADGRSVTIATLDEGNQPAGTLRVTGAVSGTGFGASDALTLAAERIDIDATSGGISLTGSNGQLGGVLELVGRRVHVAEAAILDRLATNPTYAARDADLDRAPATPRPDGVVRAGSISVELIDLAGSGTAAAPYSVLVQNVGTQQLRAGFVTSFAEIVSPASAVPGMIDLNVNGQLVTPTGTLTGVTVRDALMAEDNPARYTASSRINGCALTGACGQAPPPPPPVEPPPPPPPPVEPPPPPPPPVVTPPPPPPVEPPPPPPPPAPAPRDPQPAISTEITLLSSVPADDALFGNEEAIEDNEEEGGDDSASSPISPPTPLFNTKPLEQKSDTDEPVSGGGNPALIGSGPVEGEK